MPATAILPGANGNSPAVRLRRAERADAGSLAELFEASEGEMLAWLESGGALLVEAGEVGGEGSGAQSAGPRPVAAVRWQRGQDGWRVEPPVTNANEQTQAYDRWLMTKLEALAIKGNVARLDVTPCDPALVPYFRRLGFTPTADGEASLSKAVNGVWQRHGSSS